MPAHCRARGVLVSAGSDLKSRTGFAANLLPGSRANKKPGLLNRGLDSSTRWEQRKVGEGGVRSQKIKDRACGAMSPAIS